MGEKIRFSDKHLLLFARTAERRRRTDSFCLHMESIYIKMKNYTSENRNFNGSLGFQNERMTMVDVSEKIQGIKNSPAPKGTGELLKRRNGVPLEF